jgi:hypothetical protein
MESPTPPLALDLVRLAQRKAAQSANKCPHCGLPVLIEPRLDSENAEKTAANAQPFPPLARTREAKPMRNP